MQEYKREKISKRCVRCYASAHAGQLEWGLGLAEGVVEETLFFVWRRAKELLPIAILLSRQFNISFTRAERQGQGCTMITASSASSPLSSLDMSSGTRIFCHSSLFPGELKCIFSNALFRSANFYRNESKMFMNQSYYDYAQIIP